MNPTIAWYLIHFGLAALVVLGVTAILERGERN